jgi:hypothetical protein
LARIMAKVLAQVSHWLTAFGGYFTLDYEYESV